MSDNDLYTSLYRDGYYTNGLFLTYRTVSNSDTKNLAKKIYSYQVGHMMYTSAKATIESANLHDRPFAGYFFGEFGISRFYNSNSIIITNLQIGVLGPNAKGQELQNFMHSIYNYPEAKGWKHQIHNAFALNLNSKFIKYLPKLSSSSIDISSYNSLKIGTIFTDISTGLYTRIGFKKLQELSNSVAFNSNLNTIGQNFSESFVFVKPMLNYIFYDATIQGSFLNETSPVTYKVNPITFSLELGYLYSHKRISFGYTFIFHTKKLKSVKVPNSNTYGSIYFGYYFN